MVLSNGMTRMNRIVSATQINSIATVFLRQSCGMNENTVLEFHLQQMFLSSLI